MLTIFDKKHVFTKFVETFLLCQYAKLHMPSCGVWALITKPESKWELLAVFMLLFHILWETWP
jgi:hypothetical protein